MGLLLLTAAASSCCFAELPRLAHLGVAFTADDQGQVLIGAIASESNGARAGLQRGDIVLEAGGVPAKAVIEFVRPLIRRADGDSVAFKVLRAGRELAVPVSYIAPAKENPKGLRVEYSSVKVRDHERRTLVTFPSDAKLKRYPALLYLSGGGCASQESSADEPEPAVAVLHDLTRRGFITMRVEKTGIGDSGGPPCSSDEADITQEVEGYRAGFAVLSSHPHVDPKRIYLFGRSAGATLAPLVARDLKVARIAVAGAMGSNFRDSVVAMRDRIRAFEGREKVEVTRACLVRLLDELESPDEIETKHPECRGEVRFEASTPFIRQWDRLDLSEAWSHVKVPVLILHGTSDYVSSEFESKSLFLRINAMSSSKRPQAIFRTLPVDHNFAAHTSMQSSWEADQGRGVRNTKPGWALLAYLISFFEGNLRTSS